MNPKVREDPKYRPWRVLGLVLVGGGVIYAGTYTWLTLYDQLAMKSELQSQKGIVASEIIYDELNQPVVNQNAKLFIGYEATTLRREKYPATGCATKRDLFDNDQILKNCIYTVGTNNGPMWTTKLTSGEYHYIPQNPFNTARDETDGPSYVTFERSAEGNLNNDGLTDAVVILRLNYGGTGNWLNMIVLIQEENGEYDQMANYMFEDREIVHGLLINNGIITARIITHAEGDGLCCPSIYDTYRFKL